MIGSNHLIELYINKELVELQNQKSLGLRINSTLFDPTKTSTTQAEYSYSFKIPSTPRNDRILNYANNLSRTNKFHVRYSAEVYADGVLLFDGSITVQGYDTKSKEYECNLVNIKINTLDEIFGEAKLSDIPWYVDFEGAETINEVNNSYSNDYFFPFVSYGVFKKDYIMKDEVGATYTSKFVCDKYNRWWVDTFYPSMNVLETVKRAFEWKGYKIGGNAFQDNPIRYVYASCNLGDEQVPTYNLGNPKFGKVHVTATFDNSASQEVIGGHGGGKSDYDATGLNLQDLTFPYYKVKAPIMSSRAGEIEYNFTTIDWWNMLYSGCSSVEIESPTYMYDPNQMLIVIPASGWYKIDMTVNCQLSGNGTSFKAEQWKGDYENGSFEEKEISLTRDIREHTPIEVQLIRNYEDNIELIKGRKNKAYVTGDPNLQTYRYGGQSVDWNNIKIWDTDYPHQDLYDSEAPTKTEGVITSTTSKYQSNSSSSSDSSSSSSSSGGGGSFGGGGFGGGSSYGGTRSPRRSRGDSSFSSTTFGGTRGVPNTYGYMHKNGSVMPYDQCVSTAFICGFSSYMDGTVSVMRNGSSWSRHSSVNNKIFANVDGLELVEKDGSNGTKTTDTNYCYNEYKEAPTSTLSVNGNVMSGHVSCCVWLEKNDRIEPILLQRDYNALQKYSTTATLDLTVEAMSKRDYNLLRADSNWSYNSETEFSRLLNLGEFMNDTVTISSWVKNIMEAFNLEMTQNGDVIDINVKRTINHNSDYAIDIDDRVNSSESSIQSKYISYPREMAVKYKIDTEEWGYEKTVPWEHINDSDWAEWGDSGYTVIQLSDDTYQTDTQNIQTDFSYTYYDTFVLKNVNYDGTEDSSTTGVTVQIPVIEKAEFMADGYGYEEAQKHDGYSMTQRFWFRDHPTQEYVWTSDMMRDKIYLSIPLNSWNGVNLSYKDSEVSLLTRYFNCYPMLASNYVEVDVYLTPTEYRDLKDGAMVKFDDDLYLVSQIQGYDPQGGNKTKLRLVKKV